MKFLHLVFIVSIIFMFKAPNLAVAQTSNTYNCVHNGSSCQTVKNCIPGWFADPAIINCSDFSSNPGQCNSMIDVPCSKATTTVQCGGGTGVQTAIGCISFEPTELAKDALGWGLGIGGGIALLMIGWAGISIMTSAGDPKKMQGGKELLTAAVSGLLLIIFSTFILRFFGVTVFDIF